MEISYGAVARVMKETGFDYEKARALVEARRLGAAGARSALKKDGFWLPGGAGGKPVGQRRKDKVAAKQAKTAAPRRKKTRKVGRLDHGTRPR